MRHFPHSDFFLEFIRWFREMVILGMHGGRNKAVESHKLEFEVDDMGDRSAGLNAMSNSEPDSPRPCAPLVNGYVGR